MARRFTYAQQPECAEETNELVDPGEYKVESYYCRWLCCNPFYCTVEGIYLDIKVPTKAVVWITYEEPYWSAKEYSNAVHGWTELDFVKERIAGMTAHWKAFDLNFISIPKLSMAAVGPAHAGPPRSWWHRH